MKKIKKTQDLMKKEGIELLVVSPSSNMYYLSNFTDEPGERLLMLLVPASSDPIFLVPELYAEQVKKNSILKDIRLWSDSDEPRILLESTLEELNIEDGRVAVNDTMWASFLLMLQETSQNCNFTLASDLLTPLRREKSPDELASMEKAGTIADQAFEEVSQLPLQGMTELEVASELEKKMLKRGGDKVAFETLVASGPNSALPHHRAGKRTIQEGDSVIFDFGCEVNGYCSDTSRTVVCGTPSSKQKEVYKILKEAQEKAYQTVEPNIEAQVIDRIARQYLSNAGYGGNFPHRTGHGIGLDVHEEPYIVEGNNLRLKEGMTFSVEPGIYFQGNFGVRIEDIIVVTQDGGRRLNNSSRELKSV